MRKGGNIYGGVVVRLSDRLILCKAPGLPASDFSISELVWADVVSKCSVPNVRTSSNVSIAQDESLEGLGHPRVSYHIVSDSELAFAILADESVPMRRAHAALDDASKTFRKMFVENVSKLNIKTVDVFVKPYRDLLLRVSESEGPDDKVQKVKMAVEEVRELALDNVERVIERGQRIEDIVRSTEDLQLQAQGFQRSSRDLRRQLWWNSMKGKMLIAGVAIFLIFLVVFAFSGGSSDNKSQ
ncbi:putative Synaptobrevin [Trypanosoma vivax]|nr:vesicule-associated membrane protein [Trypanosoma vivax]KAH8616575.1 putative Synaptobrevin [Trypanosoma vivax]